MNVNAHTQTQTHTHDQCRARLASSTLGKVALYRRFDWVLFVGPRSLSLSFLSDWYIPPLHSRFDQNSWIRRLHCKKGLLASATRCNGRMNLLGVVGGGVCCFRGGIAHSGGKKIIYTVDLAICGTYRLVGFWLCTTSIQE